MKNLFIVGLLIVAAVSGCGSSSSYSSSYESEVGYNDSVPTGMSRAESNYIGNTAAQHGYSESEAKQIRDAIHRFNQAQKRNSY